MQLSNHYIPPGASVLAPHLIVKDACAALEFYREAFGVVEIERHAAPEGCIAGGAAPCAAAASQAASEDMVAALLLCGAALQAAGGCAA